MAYAGYSPTKTEINLGGVALDSYNSANHGTIPSCPYSYTVRQCYSLMFNNNPSIGPYSSSNYIVQGITGVRFQFGLMGGGASTAWDGSGNVRSAWTSNLSAFLSDLRSYGIVRVTPTPNLGGWPGDPYNPGPGASCFGTALVYYSWLPYGELASNGFPDCQGNNQGYNIANSNPYFWGWSPYFSLVYSVFSAMQASGLQLAEFDMINEINVMDFTVQARLIYDNVHPGKGHAQDVLGTIRYYAAQFGFDPNVITYSTPLDRPNPGTNSPCGSVYGDSATLIKEDGLMGAMAGGYSLFGDPSGANTSDLLWCGGTTTGMIPLPVYYTQPTINDVHIYPCFGPCVGSSTPDSTLFAQAVYSGAWSLLGAHGLTGNVFMVGETQPDQYCDNFTPALATQNVNGYLESTLYSNHASLTTLRIWNNPQSCYSAPTIVNPPYTP